MGWYRIRLDSDSDPLIVQDERSEHELAATYVGGRTLEVEHFSEDIRGVRSLGTIVLLYPHIVSIRPREAPKT